MHICRDNVIILYLSFIPPCCLFHALLVLFLPILLAAQQNYSYHIFQNERFQYDNMVNNLDPIPEWEHGILHILYYVCTWCTYIEMKKTV